MGIFANFAPKYYEKNLFVMPVAGKKPVLKGWQHYCNKAPSANDFDLWSEKYGDLNISIMLGRVNNLIGLDVDTDDPKAQAIIEKILPPSPVVKKGKRGYTAFYRFDFKKHNLSHKVIKVAGVESAVEILVEKHTVIPPSIHPDTNTPYKWITFTDLLDIEFSDIPELTLEKIKELELRLAGLIQSDPGFVSGNKMGRNNYLKTIVARLIGAKTPTDEAIGILIREDRLAHGDNSLFSDSSENHGSDNEWMNALRFYSSNFLSIGQRNIKDKKFVEVPYSAQFETSERVRFEHVDDGFISKEVVDGKARKVVHHYDFADYMISKYHFCSSDKYVIRYNGTHFVPMDDTAIGKIVDTHTKRKMTNASQKNLLMRTLKDQASEREEMLRDTVGMINLKNGIYDFKAKELIDHSPFYNFRYCLDYNYDASATCPQFIDFMNQTFLGSEDSIKLIQEYLAYTLIGGAPFLHKALCFVGSGRNGKSTLLNVIKGVIGRRNISSVPLQKIDKEFSAVGLFNKLANVLEELTGDQISSDAFKNIISGGTVVMAYKQKDNFEAPVTARFIFATNDMPVFKDTTAGLHERIVFVDFPNYVPEEKRDYLLDAKLAEEIPGVLNWALEVLPFKKNFRLSEPRESKALKNSYITESNSVAAWFEDCVEITDKDWHSHSTGELYKNYLMWAEKSGRNAVALLTFSKRLKEIMKRKCRELKLEFNNVSYKRRDSRGYKFLNLISLW